MNRAPLNARLSAPEHARMLDEARCGVLVFGPGLVERAVALKALRPDLVCLHLETDLLALAQT